MIVPLLEQRSSAEVGAVGPPLRLLTTQPFFVEIKVFLGADDWGSPKTSIPSPGGLIQNRVAKLPCRGNVLPTVGIESTANRSPRKLRVHLCLAALVLLLRAAALSSAELRPETVRAWNAYIAATTRAMQERASGQRSFLWADETPQRLERLRRGEVLVAPIGGYSPHRVPHGLIHDWLGAVFVPKAHLNHALDVLHDYDHYKDSYRPLVADAKLLTHSGECETVRLLMVQRAFGVTAAVQTENQVRIENLDARRAYSLSISIRVREMAGYGTPGQHLLSEGGGPGYAWGTLSITRLEEREGGVFAEIEMIVLSRDIPLLFRWLIRPLAERLPQNVMAATLGATRNAVSGRISTAEAPAPR